MSNRTQRLLKAKYLIPTLIVLIFTTVAIQRCQAINDLKENGVLVNVTIVDYLGSMKGGSGADPSFKCNFLYKGQRRSLISSSSVKAKAFSYIGKSFPALYSERTNTLRLLMTTEDFSEFDRELPDSLSQE